MKDKVVIHVPYAATSTHAAGHLTVELSRAQVEKALAEMNEPDPPPPLLAGEYVRIGPPLGLSYRRAQYGYVVSSDTARHTLKGARLEAVEGAYAGAENKVPVFIVKDDGYGKGGIFYYESSRVTRVSSETL